jgi:signal-transduction protein with cAMP-binding, CBS, and nucleotidyltransferase domain
MKELESARYKDELDEASRRLIPLLAEYFRVRGSVSTIHLWGGAAFDRLLTAAISLAEEVLTLDGRSSPGLPYALLADGCLGRSETGPFHRGQLFLVYDGEGSDCRDYFSALTMKIAAILNDNPLLRPSGALPSRERFICSSRREWLARVSAELTSPRDDRSRRFFSTGGGGAGEERFAAALESVADLRTVAGDRALGEAVVAAGHDLLTQILTGESFWRHASHISSLPIALGVFGRFRLARTGSHRGELDLQHLALDPLVEGVRILAVHYGVRSSATVDRIKALQASGSLGVALAERLLVACHDFFRCHLEQELRLPDAEGETFFNPETMDDVSRERMKSGLEDLGTLQRLVYQQLVEVDR